MKKKLVILTTHFGTNFSGGSTATCEIFSRIENEFSKVVVLGTELGEHKFENLEFIKYSNWFNAVSILKRLNSKRVVFYGDFYNSFLFIFARVSFYFTYHDNWPELGQTSFKYRLKSIFFTNIYKRVLKSAITSFTVSKQKYEYIKLLTENVLLVRNGFDENVKYSKLIEREGILMVGNIDQRKYDKALLIFEKLEGLPINVDIYGKVNDKRLSKRLSKFSFITLKGFQSSIPYHGYKLLLHTSIMENLPIVFCEALHAGTPVLAFDVGGIREIINTQNGRLISPYELNKMKATLLKILSGHISFSSKNKYLDEFSWSKASSYYKQNLL